MLAAREMLGTKHTCTACGGRFYDLGRPEPRCPKCGGLPKQRKLRVGQAVVAEPPAPKLRLYTDEEASNSDEPVDFDDLNVVEDLDVTDDVD